MHIYKGSIDLNIFTYSFRDETGVVCSEKPEHPPILQFSDINFPQYVQDWLEEYGLQYPTAVQAYTWPSILSGRNVFLVGPVCINNINFVV